MEEGVGTLMDLLITGFICKKNMKKQSRVEALPIFYRVWQLLPANEPVCPEPSAKEDEILVFYVVKK